METQKLNQLSVIPLYKQLKKLIETEIDEGRMLPGAPLPSENELGARFGVSRVTVRAALQELADEGRLLRQRGKGTFVMQQPAKRLFTFSDDSFTESCAAAGIAPTRRLLSAELTPASAADIRALKLREGEDIVCVRRVMLADGVPMMLAVDHILPEFAYLLDEDIEHNSLNALMRKSGSFADFISKDRTLEAIAADAELSELLRIPMGQPMLLLYDLMGDEAGRPLRRTYEYIAGDKVKYAYK